MHIGCPVVENVYSSRSCSSPESLSVLASCLFPSRINREYLIKKPSYRYLLFICNQSQSISSDLSFDNTLALVMTVFGIIRD